MAQQSTSSTTSTIPDYISKPTKGALGDIDSFLKSDANYVYGSKPGESLVTPLDQNQLESIGNVEWLADQDLAELYGINKANGLIDQFASFDPGQLTDETGYLGSIQGDMDPYLEQVLGPQIRKMQEQAQIGRRDLADGATMNGSFGDSRHGVLEGDIYSETQKNIGDTTGQAYSQAYRDAMERRASDRAAMVGQNANKMTAASGVAGLGKQYQDQWNAVNDALFNSGEVRRDAAEEKRLAQENYQTQVKDKRYNDALRLLGAVRGAPYQASSKTKSSQESDDGLWSVIGAGLGAVLA